MRHGRLLLALSGEREEAVVAVQGEEYTWCAPHAGPVTRKFGVREQPQLKFAWGAS